MDEKQKILNVMKRLERDYKEGNISPKKYKYYMAKYQDKLSYLNKNEATNRIRSMQGKPTPDLRSNRQRYDAAKNRRRREESDLVQKYIINPKKGDKDLNKKEKKPMDSGTYKLLVVLILAIGFTAGMAVGVFGLDFSDLSVVNSNALVEDTSFPDLSNVTLEVENTTTTYYTSNTTHNTNTNSSGSGGGSSGGGGGDDPDNSTGVNSIRILLPVVELNMIEKVSI